MTSVTCPNCSAAHAYGGPEPAFVVCPRCGWICRVASEGGAIIMREPLEVEVVGLTKAEVANLIARQDVTRALVIRKETRQ